MEGKLFILGAKGDKVDVGLYFMTGETVNVAYLGRMLMLEPTARGMLHPDMVASLLLQEEVKRIHGG